MIALTVERTKPAPPSRRRQKRTYGAGKRARATDNGPSTDQRYFSEGNHELPRLLAAVDIGPTVAATTQAGNRLRCGLRSMVPRVLATRQSGLAPAQQFAGPDGTHGLLNTLRATPERDVASGRLFIPQKRRVQDLPQLRLCRQTPCR